MQERSVWIRKSLKLNPRSPARSDPGMYSGSIILYILPCIRGLYCVRQGPSFSNYRHSSPLTVTPRWLTVRELYHPNLA